MVLLTICFEVKLVFRYNTRNMTSFNSHFGGIFICSVFISLWFNKFRLLFLVIIPLFMGAI
jgi:hypothetical protein